MELDPQWRYVPDGVMGGVSEGRARREMVAGRIAMRLQGTVSLENNGGFIQLSGALTQGPGVFDASAWQGLAFESYGNGETYELRLRTDALRRPWQSFRAAFDAPARWTTQMLPFRAFEPHRTEANLDPARLRRLGFLAIGRAFEADLAITGLRLYG